MRWDCIFPSRFAVPNALIATLPRAFSPPPSMSATSTGSSRTWTQAPGWAAGIGADLPRLVDTVYLGGGTPSLLSAALIRKLFAALRAHFELTPDAEITVECAPGQLAADHP